MSYAGTELQRMGDTLPTVMTAAFAADNPGFSMRMATVLQQPKALPDGLIITIGPVVAHSVCSHLKSAEGVHMVRKLLDRLVRPEPEFCPGCDCHPCQLAALACKIWVLHIIACG